MKAALLTTYNAPLEIAEIMTQPEPTEYGQVLVKILTSGICGAQLQEIDGFKKGGPLPHPLGHEACAEVVQIGTGVTKVKVGDRVVCHWRKGDGIESKHPKYWWKGEMITGGKVTTFSEYSVCSENRLTLVPRDTPSEFAALLGCGLSTALGTIEHEANLKMGESILIIGCGGLGLNLILAARLRRAGFIQVADSNSLKKVPAESMGADRFYHFPKDALGKADVVIDTSGDSTAIAEGFKALNPSGRFIMVGQPRKAVTIEGPIHLFEGEGKMIRATQGGGFNPSRDIPRYVKLLHSGQLDIRGIVTHRILLDEINKGIEMVRDGLAGRVLITP